MLVLELELEAADAAHAVDGRRLERQHAARRPMRAERPAQPLDQRGHASARASRRSSHGLRLTNRCRVLGPLPQEAEAADGEDVLHLRLLVQRLLRLLRGPSRVCCRRRALRALDGDDEVALVLVGDEAAWAPARKSSTVAAERRPTKATSDEDAAGAAAGASSAA